MEDKNQHWKKNSQGFGGPCPTLDIQSATLDAVVDFLIWKDNFGKTKVHQEGCHFSEQKGNSQCTSPKRLAYGTVDSLIGKLHSISCLQGRGSDESPIPGFGNPISLENCQRISDHDLC